MGLVGRVDLPGGGSPGNHQHRYSASDHSFPGGLSQFLILQVSEQYASRVVTEVMIDLAVLWNERNDGWYFELLTPKTVEKEGRYTEYTAEEFLIEKVH